jgi:hypothetical protein
MVFGISVFTGFCLLNKCVCFGIGLLVECCYFYLGLGVLGGLSCNLFVLVHLVLIKF